MSRLKWMPSPPDIERDIERPHGLRHGRPVRVGHINGHLSEPSFLDPFGVTQMRAVPLWESLGLVLRDDHVVHVIAVPLGVNVRHLAQSSAAESAAISASRS